MPILALVALLASQSPAATLPTKSVYTAAEIADLSQQAKRDCGFSNPQQLIGLPEAVRDQALPCFVHATVEQSGSMLPKEVEPGATIVSATEFEHFLVFAMQFEPDHPRASVPKGQTSDYDGLLSNLTCQDKWLGGLIDAGIVDGTQAGTMIIYKLQNEKRENLAAIAVGQCFDAK